jgi:hypothetical protein
MRRTAPDPIGALFDAFWGGRGLDGFSLSSTLAPIPLALQRIKRIVSRIQYKPGWEIRVYQTPKGGVGLLYEMPTVERDTKKPTRLTFTFAYEGFTSEDQLVHTVMSNLLALEDHEAREFFVYDGERLYDPHAVTTRDPKGE